MALFDMWQDVIASELRARVLSETEVDTLLLFPSGLHEDVWFKVNEANNAVRVS